MRFKALFFLLFIIVSCKKNDNFLETPKSKEIDSTVVIIKSIRDDVKQIKEQLKNINKKEGNSLYNKFRGDLNKKVFKIYTFEYWLSDFDSLKNSKQFQRRLKLLDKGYIETFDIGDNIVDIRINPDLFYKIFSNHVTDDYKKFIKIEIEQGKNYIEKNGELSISLKSLGKYLIDWEDFLNNHKHSELYTNARVNYFYLLSLYLYGTGKASTFKEKVEKDFYTRRVEYFYNKNSEEFSKFTKKHNSSNSAAIIRQFLRESKYNTLEFVYQSIQKKAEALYPSVIFPTTGITLKSFEKGGYVIQMTAEGDLNGDKIDDAVIVLKNKIDSSDFRPTLFLLKGGGKYNLKETGWSAFPEEYSGKTKRYNFEGISIDSLNKFHMIMRNNNGIIETEYSFSNNTLNLEELHFNNHKNEKFDYFIQSGEIKYTKTEAIDDDIDHTEEIKEPQMKRKIYKWPRKISINNSNPIDILNHINGELL